jgi:hypothetical protein
MLILAEAKQCIILYIHPFEGSETRSNVIASVLYVVFDS